MDRRNLNLSIPMDRLKIPMDSAEKEGGDHVHAERGRRPEHKTLLIATISIATIAIAALIAVVVVAVHTNKDNGGGPGEIGTIPPPFARHPLITPPPPPAPVKRPFGTPPSITPPPPSVRAPSLTPPSAVSNTILVACDGSTYRDLCISSLSSYRGASSANMTELAGIAIQLSLDESQLAPDFLDKLSRNATEKKEKSALEDCMELFKDSQEQLNSSLSALHRLDSKSFQETIREVQTWVRAALTNPSTCVDGFQEATANLFPAVKALTERVSEFMSNALAVVNKLAST